ncbi:hypothetical protein MTBBW1_900017 [Desulfamplus magnetovallimortis]|uniref:Methyltransferase type 11 n=1 Tax=Desulfamplus magnetovallimortis TaxID=1246637 RepID=A0A1W1HL15_9BACT|nr:class I SAM-dependent methyltransferase [Desulfamplus magnetovallimortis]SLM33150.1 hypothetical protein MTBBW1_900017 [Desulfamplus magnetovallimortis]
MTSSIEYDKEWIEQTWGWDNPEVFIETKGQNLRPRILESIKIAKLKHGMKALDVGCGRGEVVLYCARNGIQAVGVDYSSDVIKIAEAAKSKHSSAQQALMKFLCGDIEDINEQSEYDRIFLLDFVEHLNDIDLHNVLRKCRKLLKPSGYLVIHTLPNRWLYDITYGKLLRLLMPYLPENPRTEKEKKIHINEMSIVHLHKTLDKAGFYSKIWLSDLILKQAQWHLKEPLNDSRGKLYNWLNKPLISLLYKISLLTPLKLLISNDIFAIASKNQSEIFTNDFNYSIEGFAINILKKWD